MSSIEDLFMTLFLEAHAEQPDEITIDMDATDDPLHGHQEGRFFHGYYDTYCYLPLYVFCGRHLLAAKLRRANIDASAGAVEEIARIVAQIRARWPDTVIRLRADSGFAREELMAWCEENGVHYVFGLARNDRLVARIERELKATRKEASETGRAARRFKDFTWATLESWSRRRRVIAKAEWTKGEANPRFIVTSLDRDTISGQVLYEDVYCARGDMENRIKECQTDLFADRTPTATLRANQLRLWFASFAYVLTCALRRIALAGTELAQATCGSIRLKLLKGRRPGHGQRAAREDCTRLLLPLAGTVRPRPCAAQPHRAGGTAQTRRGLRPPTSPNRQQQEEKPAPDQPLPRQRRRMLERNALCGGHSPALS